MPLASRKKIERATLSAQTRLLVVDDSAVARAALSRIIDEDPALHVVAALAGAREAIDWLHVNDVDIILLDIQMPGVDGLTALPELLSVSKGARVLIVSTLASEGAKASIKALTLGATDVLAKPTTDGLGRHFGTVLLDRIRRLSSASAAAVALPKRQREIVRRRLPDTPVACLGIGASTGGLHALIEFFKHLSNDFDAPILLTQHLPPSFIRLFAEQMADASGRKVSIASDAMPVRHGEVVIAPGDAHLTVEHRNGRSVMKLTHDEVASRCKPSVDPMFSSIATCYGEKGMAVVLTGMGRDGAEGARAIAEAGGTVIVQDELSAAIWGMPGVVARAGHSSLVARPSQLASYVSQCGVAE